MPSGRKFTAKIMRPVDCLHLFLTLNVYLLGVNCEECEFKYEQTKTSVEIFLRERSILKHSLEEPAVDVGIGKAEYRDHLGNFHIQNEIEERISLPYFEVLLLNEGGETVPDNQPVSGKDIMVEIVLNEREHEHEDGLQISIAFVCDEEKLNSVIVIETIKENTKKEYNRLWIKLTATPTEKIYGGGEQYTHFQMRGHAFPIWAREQGVGRDTRTVVTKLAEWIGSAGGDYHTTYWPQTTFLSSRLLYIHANHSYYNVMNFTQENYHELEFWEDITSIEIYFDTANSWPALLTKLTNFFGRQPKTPEWLYNGAVLGLQGGKETTLEKYNRLQERGVKISAIWIQDWSGKFITSLGKRVYWNWRMNTDFYWKPDESRSVMDKFREYGVRYLAYINPHVIEDSEMYHYADSHGYFIKNSDTDSTFLINFGEFHCGTVDLTNPEAYAWYKSVLMDMLDIGFSGWMADFGGEYLPVDSKMSFYDQSLSSAAMHNYYSYLWAKLNKEAIVEAGKLGEAFVFMRSGYASSSGQTLMAWAGDQNVDYSYGDGLASVIPATLSLGLSGMGLSHSDIGGYVSLLMMVRNQELLLRWAEMSVFTPVMRTHECNRPDRNWQVYTTNKTIDDFAQLTKLYSLLAEYHEMVSLENSWKGWPAQRPLFFHYSADETSYDIQYQYLYGPDLLVAPVLTEGARTWRLYLPPDDWIYLWDDLQYSCKKEGGRYVTVEAPLGRPPVFYRKNSKWESSFLKLRANKSAKTEEPEGLSFSLLWSNPVIFVYLLLRKMFYYIFFYF